jgi:hypothetical protein
MRKTKKKKTIYDYLSKSWAFYCGLAVTAMAVFLSWSKFTDIMHSDIHLFFLAVMLSAFTFGLFFAYARATNNELNLLNDFLGEEFIPRIGIKTDFIALGLAILISALIALSANLIAYSVVMVVYNIFDIWANWHVAQIIGPAFEKKLQKERDEKQLQSLKIIKSFYFDNPTIPRIVTIMFFNWIVICFALSYYFTSNELLRNCGYLILLANIAGGEIIIHFWRWRSIYKLS